MKTKLTALTLIISCFLLSDCAALFHGSSENVNFGSNPVGAEVLVDGRMMGHTPINYKLESKRSYVIEFRFEGKTQTINLGNHVGAGWIILDILGGLLPIIVDAATGAWFSFDQSNLYVDFSSSGFVVPTVTNIPAAQSNAPTSEKKVRIVKSGAELKSNSSLDSETIMDLPVGAEFEIDRRISEDWIKIKLPPNKVGIVISGYVQIKFISIVDAPIQ